MTKEHALEKWSQAASVSDQGVRLDNWVPIAHALRHCSGEGDEIDETSPGIVKVTVNKEGARAPFSLVVA